MSVEKVLSIPELMDYLYGWLPYKDLKSCRLVCKKMRDQAAGQMSRRSHINIGSEDKDPIDCVKGLASLNGHQFKKFTIQNTLPTTLFLVQFRDTLTVLHLKNVCFTSLSALRKVLFEAYKSLKDLSLRDVTILETTICSESWIQVDRDDVPKVARVEIDHSHSPLVESEGTELFKIFKFEELVGHYSASLKELVCPSLADSCRSPQQDFFMDLKKHEIQLTHLTYRFVKNQEVASFNDYMRMYGEELRDFVRPDLPVHRQYPHFGIEALFKDLVLPKLQHMNTMYRDNFEIERVQPRFSVKHLTITACFGICLRFQSTLPNVEKITLHDDGNEYLGRYVDQVASVVALEWILLGSRNPKRESFSKLSRVFPNLKKLQLTKKKYTECRVIFEFTFQKIAESWPCLEYLDVCGELGVYAVAGNVCAKSLGGGKGNEDIAMLCRLVRMKHLKTFVYNDPNASQLYFGDEAAKKVFLKMPSLNTLRIHNCAMSDDIVKQLETKLISFSYVNRI